MNTRRNPNARKRAATNVVMFVGIAALALVAWYDVNGKLPDRNAKASLQHTVDNLNLIRHDGATFSFARDGIGWVLQQPVKVPALTERVERLVALIDSDTTDSYHVSEVNLSATGLDAPLIRMRLGADTAVFFGKTEPLSGRRYVQIDDQVILLEDQHVPLIDGGLNAFADRKPWHGKISTVHLGGATQNAQPWEQLTALGVRAHDVTVPAGATPVEINLSDTTERWFAWRDDALVALHREGGDIHYLISTTDAATLGLSL